MSLCDSWPSGDLGHPSLNLLGASLRAFRPFIHAGARVLEIGCCEADCCTAVAVADPSLVYAGIDCRPPLSVGFRMNLGGRSRLVSIRPDYFIQGDVLAWGGPIDPADVVLCLSALEHIGMGYYGDPLARDGDTCTIDTVTRWLTPGGWFYYDVPFNPEGARFTDPKCRIYDAAAVAARLDHPGLAVRWQGYGEDPGNLIDAPTAANPHETHPWWYLVRWCQRVE